MCFVILAVNIFVFRTTVASAHIRHYLFRHLELIVTPFRPGSQGIPILWSNHHLSPLLHLIQITNLKLFGAVNCCELQDKHRAARCQFHTAISAMIERAQKGCEPEVVTKSDSIDALWDLHPTGLVITNRERALLRIRVRLLIKAYSKDEITHSLSAMGGGGYTMDAFGGRQGLFFSVPGGGTVELQTVRERVIKDLELRR